MFKPIPGNDEFLISSDGVFVNRYITVDGLGCTPTILNNKVTLDFYGVTKELSVEWISAIAKYEIYLENVNDIVISVDTSPRPTCTLSMDMCIATRPTRVGLK